VPEEKTAAAMVAQTAQQLLDLDQRIKDNGRDLTASSALTQPSGQQAWAADVTAPTQTRRSNSE